MKTRPVKLNTAKHHGNKVIVKLIELNWFFLSSYKI